MADNAGTIKIDDVRKLLAINASFANNATSQGSKEGEFLNDISMKVRFSFGPVPDVMGFSLFWQSIKEQILEHVKDQDACYIWIKEMEHLTWDQLAEMGQFPIADRELGRALELILSKKLRSDLTVYRDKARIQGKRIRGIQIGYMLWHSFAMTQVNANKMQTRKLEEVTLHGDDLRSFMNEWDRVMMFFGGLLPDQLWLELTFREQVNKRAKFKLQLEM